MEYTKLIQEILASGVTQSQLGESLGKSQAWVCAASQGKYKDLKSTDLKKLRNVHRRIDAKRRNAA